MEKSNRKLSISEVERILKKQKLIFAFLNSSVKRDSLYQHYCLPLKKLFGKVIVFDPSRITLSYGYRKMEELFVSLIKKEKPEYIFINNRRDELTLETLEKLRKASPATRIISTSGDLDKDFEPVKRYEALFMDGTIIHSVNYLKNYYKEGVKNIYPTLGINTEILKPLNLKKIYDVTFVGNSTEGRVKIMRFLIKNGVNLKIFGGRWDIYPEFKQFCLGYVSPKEMARVVNQTKVNLGLSKDKYGNSVFNWRVFELASCKSFSLVDYFEEYLKFFKNNKEIIMFKNNSELLEKIKYYLKHKKEREKIAENAYKIAVKKCNILEEFKILFKKIMENPEIFSQKFPKINGKIITLTKKDMKKRNKEIQELLNEFEYVSFSEGNSISLKYKNYLQAYSLEKTKKQISCCDYYIYDKTLGDYLTTNVFRAFKILRKEKFNQALSLNQIMVTKDYFIENMNKFREFFNGKMINLVDEKNTGFISIPLVRNNKINKMDFDVFDVFFHQKKFIFEIHRLLKQKKLFTSLYFYKMFYLLLKNLLLRKYFIKLISNKKFYRM